MKIKYLHNSPKFVTKMIFNMRKYPNLKKRI